jgi:hypothetical protein
MSGTRCVPRATSQRRQRCSETVGAQDAPRAHSAPARVAWPLRREWDAVFDVKKPAQE